MYKEGVGLGDGCLQALLGRDVLVVELASHHVDAVLDLEELCLGAGHDPIELVDRVLAQAPHLGSKHIHTHIHGIDGLILTLIKVDQRILDPGCPFVELGPEFVSTHSEWWIVHDIRSRVDNFSG